MKNSLHAKVSAVALSLAVGLVLSGCGSNDNTTMPTAAQTPTAVASSDTATATPQPNVGVGVEITSQSDGKLFYNVEHPEGGYAEGEVVITVGSWTHTSDDLTGYVQPKVLPGDYTATVQYTDPNGGTLNSSTSYHLDKVNTVKIITMKNQGLLNQEWEATVEVIGNPIVTGTVTLVRQDGSTFASGKVTESGDKYIARITMPAQSDNMVERMYVEYSGDQYNPEGKSTATFIYNNQSN